MRLDDARLCLDCEEVHEEQVCPSCGSEAFAYLTRWVQPASDRAPRRRPEPPATRQEPRTSEQLDAYRQLLSDAPPRSKAGSSPRAPSAWRHWAWPAGPGALPDAPALEIASIQTTAPGSRDGQQVTARVFTGTHAQLIPLELMGPDPTPRGTMTSNAKVESRDPPDHSGTVFRDYHSLMNLAGYQDVIAKDADTALKVNISWHFFFPGSSTTPWQLDGVIRAMKQDGYDPT